MLLASTRSMHPASLISLLTKPQLVDPLASLELIHEEATAIISQTLKTE